MNAKTAFETHYNLTPSNPTVGDHVRSLINKSYFQREANLKYALWRINNPCYGMNLMKFLTPVEERISDIHNKAEEFTWNLYPEIVVNPMSESITAAWIRKTDFWNTFKVPAALILSSNPSTDRVDTLRWLGMVYGTQTEAEAKFLERCKTVDVNTKIVRL